MKSSQMGGMFLLLGALGTSQTRFGRAFAPIGALAPSHLGHGLEPLNAL